MYSVVLMATMAAGAPETPQFNGLIRARIADRWYAPYAARYSYSYGCACYGGCWGSCSGCCGGCWGAPSRIVSYGYAPMRVYGGDVWGANYIYSGSTPFIKVTPPEEPKKITSDQKLGGSARLIIDVPPDAKVTVDGQPTKSTAGVRLFHTPKLDDGESYFYDVKVEIPSGGETVTRTKRVYVHANEIVRESFAPDRGTSVANK